MSAKSVSHFSGIYVIVNAKSGKIYLGQAQDIRKRWRQHKNDLRKNKHHNRYMQRAYNKYGDKIFQFKVLEYCSTEQLNEREDHYLKTYMPKGICYNMCPNAGTVRGIVRSKETLHRMSEAHKGKPLSVETRRKISALKIGKPRSEETRHRISEAKRGIPRSEETRRRVSETKGQFFVVTSPDNVEYEIKGLARFCRENNLSNKNLCEVASGKRSHHKGWKCRKID